MTSHAVCLTTRDGRQLEFVCANDTNVVSGAAEAGIALPVQCRSGRCGTCRATCTDGAYELDSYDPAVLPAEAAAHREILLCRTLPRGPLSIVLPFTASQIASAGDAREATVVETQAVGGGVVRLLLLLDPDERNGNAASFEPGQFMELEIPNTGIKRAYSLANTPNWDGHLEFLIRLQPTGIFSFWLQTAARPGVRLVVRGPLGSLVLDQGSLRPRCLVGGGTGLAPLLSMLRRMAEWQEPHPVRLYFGVTAERDLFCLEALNRLRGELPQLVVTVCVWRPGPDWTGFAGLPAEALRRDLENGSVVAPDIYVCGPPALVEAVVGVARDSGLDEHRVFGERFLPSST